MRTDTPRVIRQTCTICHKMYEPPQNSSFRMGDMMHVVPYRGSTNIMRHRTKVSRLGDLAPRRLNCSKVRFLCEMLKMTRPV
jgi:hypothetical protein